MTDFVLPDKRYVRFPPRADIEPVLSQSRAFRFALCLRFSLSDLPLLVEVRLVSKAHTDDRGGHPDDQYRIIPTGRILLEPSNSSQKEDAGNRCEIADRLPVDSARRRNANCSLFHAAQTP